MRKRAAAKRPHVHGEFFMLEKDGIPVIDNMDAREMDYLEQKDPNVNQAIARTRKEFDAGKGTPAANLLTKLDEIARKAKARTRRPK